jgi:hypothetical protein
MRVSKINRAPRIFDYDEPTPLDDVPMIDTAPMTKEELEEIDASLSHATLEEANKKAATLEAEGFTTVVTSPEWATPYTILDYLFCSGEDPGSSHSIVLRLALIGGGEVELRMKSHVSIINGDKSEHLDSEMAMTIVDSESSSSYRGKLLYDGFEMQCAIYATRGCPEELINRVDRTLKAIEEWESLCALLAPSERCFCCARPLRDEVSKIIGVGPDCAKRIGISHGWDTATMVLEYRKSLLEVGV